MAAPFTDCYAGRTVLVTGHTGFKGSWLAAWLTQLGAHVVGYALEPPTEPSHFAACRLAKRVSHVHGDVRDFPRLARVFAEYRPEIVFHLAAQAIVRRSLDDRRGTFETNVMGTVNVLDAARDTDSVRAMVMVTTDKCYRDQEWPWAYRETDELGGRDPYSASKACAELVIAAYQNRRFQKAAAAPVDVPIASVRAGNVIGGGDWAADRIVPDTVRAIAAGTDVVIRQPRAVRPWQHVLDSLSGYLWLGASMTRDPEAYNSAWNFGPSDAAAVTVTDVVGKILERWRPPATRLVIRPDPAAVETAIMRLDSSKALQRLGWKPTWELDRTVDAVVAWYHRFQAREQDDMYPFTVEQINDYASHARELRLPWAG
jgi:CDP-glucose 4,6-dehydratase